MNTAQIRSLQQAIKDRIWNGYSGDDNTLLANINSFFDAVVKPETLSPGDRVRFSEEGDAKPAAELLSSDNYFYITEANLRENGSIEYATDSSAWHSREDFVLVERASVETLVKIAGKIFNNEDE